MAPPTVDQHGDNTRLRSTAHLVSAISCLGVMRTMDDTFFSDVLIAAVDGGISHWAVTRNVERFEDCYVRLEVRDIEGEMDWQVLDTSVIVDGVNRICRGGLLAKESERSIQQAAELQVAGLINPYLADYIVQAGLFGEVVFK